MKNKINKLLIVIVAVLYSLDMVCQQTVEVHQDNGLNIIYFIDGNQKEVLLKFAYKIEVLDAVITESKISIIVEEPLSFCYYKFIRKESKWNMELCSGDFAPTFKFLSASDSLLLSSQPIKESFKLVDADKIEYITVSGERKSYTSSRILERNNRIKIDLDKATGKIRALK